MTLISEMTNDELDRYIAEKRGWKYWDEYQCWLNPTHRELGIIYELPSYTTDPRCAMELLKEMSNCALKRWGDKWCCGIYNDKGYLENQANIYDTPERAISEAYAQWKEGMVNNITPSQLPNNCVGDNDHEHDDRIL